MTALGTEGKNLANAAMDENKNLKEELARLQKELAESSENGGDAPNGDSSAQHSEARTGTKYKSRAERTEEQLDNVKEENEQLAQEILSMQDQLNELMQGAQEQELLEESNFVKRRRQELRDEHRSLCNVHANQASRITETSRFNAGQDAFRREQEGVIREIKAKTRTLRQERETEMTAIRRLQNLEQRLETARNNTDTGDQQEQEIREECAAKDKVIESLEAKVLQLEKKRGSSLGGKRRSSIPNTPRASELDGLRKEYAALRAEIEKLGS